MKLIRNLVDGQSVCIVARTSTKQRLSTTCFRIDDDQQLKTLAGNFARWRCIEDILNDHWVGKEFLLEVAQLLKEKDCTTVHSVEIPHADSVGWSSTAPLREWRKFPDLERFQLNNKCYGLRVSPNRTDVLAPVTHCLTLVFELKIEVNKPVVIIHSVYPGVDIGYLVGNVTEREQCVFFDWSHKGSSIDEL